MVGAVTDLANVRNRRELCLKSRGSFGEQRVPIAFSIRIPTLLIREPLSIRQRQPAIKGHGLTI